MTAIRVPLRAGMRAGWPVVTWATPSMADVQARAHILAAAPPLVMATVQAKAIARSQLPLLLAKPGQAEVQAVAIPYLRLLRAVLGKAHVTAIAEQSLSASIWAPQQPVKQITYRRYGRDDYHQMLMDLLPRGRAWPRDGEDADLMNGWAAELARVEQRGWDLLDQIDPRTTGEMMPDWERFFGLPGTASETQRRKELIAAWLAGGSLSRDDIGNLLEQLGITASVHFHRPFRTGLSACGDALETDWISTWTVTVFAPTDLDLMWLKNFLQRIASGGDWVHVVAGW